MSYTGADMCRLTGISYRQLDYWARTGRLTPSVQPATGSGNPRLYSQHDVLRAYIARTLMDAGFNLAAAFSQAADLAMADFGQAAVTSWVSVKVDVEELRHLVRDGRPLPKRLRVV